MAGVCTQTPAYPVLNWTGGAYPEATAGAIAALFAAGAINDVGALEEAGPRASRLVPRMRDGESTGPRTTVRSG